MGSDFRTSPDSLQGTGSEPDGHRTSTLEPPSRRHLSKFPSNLRACVLSACLRHAVNGAFLQACVWGCHPSPSAQMRFSICAISICAISICVHVGRCCACKSVYRCSCATCVSFVGYFRGCAGAPRARGGAGCYGTCSFKRNLCFAELALCSV